MEEQLQTKEIAGFALKARYEDIGINNIEQLKRHLLDSIGSLIHATKKESVYKLFSQLRMLSEGGACRVPVVGKLPLDRAAQVFTALIRYPDFMDNFMGKESTCHPSDNIGSLLAVAEYCKASGKDFLRAMAISYQVECRLIEEIPVMIEGIDHTLLLSFSIIAGIAKMLALTKEQTAHALAIAGCSISPMATSRASYTFEWKGFASSFDALNSLNIALLAKNGLTGPVALFEGPKGFKEIFNMKLEYDWSKEIFELIQRCVLKEYNAEVHAQSALEAMMDIREQEGFHLHGIEQIDIKTFLTCYHIIGSGSYGNRKEVKTKEQADHSLFYLAAVALIDGEVYPEQFLPERIVRNDVQELLKKVNVHTGFPIHKPLKLSGMLDPYTHAYPNKMMSHVEIKYHDGTTLSCKKEDYHGFFTRPFTWEDTIKKFLRLTAAIISLQQQEAIIETVRDLENRDMSELLDLLVYP